jgi:hypothetical protein
MWPFGFSPQSNTWVHTQFQGSQSPQVSLIGQIHNGLVLVRFLQRITKPVTESNPSWKAWEPGKLIVGIPARGQEEMKWAVSAPAVRQEGRGQMPSICSLQPLNRLDFYRVKCQSHPETPTGAPRSKIPLGTPRPSHLGLTRGGSCPGHLNLLICLCTMKLPAGLKVPQRHASHNCTFLSGRCYGVFARTACSAQSCVTPTEGQHFRCLLFSAPQRALAILGADLVFTQNPLPLNFSPRLGPGNSTFQHHAPQTHWLVSKQTLTKWVWLKQAFSRRLCIAVLPKIPTKEPTMIVNSTGYGDVGWCSPEPRALRSLLFYR